MATTRVDTIAKLFARPRPPTIRSSDVVTERE